MSFFGIVSEKTFTIQLIPGNLIARISGNIHKRKISRINKKYHAYLNIRTAASIYRIRTKKLDSCVRYLNCINEKETMYVGTVNRHTVAAYR